MTESSHQAVFGSSANGLVVEFATESAEELFVGPQSSAERLAAGEWPTDERAPLVARICVPDQPVMVLGSGQREELLAPGIHRVRRRSGGGAVWLDPAEQLWVDLVVPKHHPWFEPDVGRSFDRVGRVWASVVQQLIGNEAGARGQLAHADMTVHDDRLVSNPWSALLCFAGRGPGEVFLGGRKVVGLAQRRGRNGSLIQSGLLLRWSFNQEWFDEQCWPADFAAAAGVGIGLNDWLQTVGLAPTITHADAVSVFVDRLETALGDQSEFKPRH